MPVVHLTDPTIRSLESSASQVDYWDQKLQGFGIRVSPNGRKSFVVMYYTDRGKRRMTLGRYPTLSLADARTKARIIQAEVFNGNDPHLEKQEARRAETFRELAEEYLERHAKIQKRSWREDERMLKRDILPSWKNLKAQDIRRRDVLRLLDRIVDRGSPIMANRTRALISKIFAFGISRDIVELNPTLGVQRPGKERQREFVLNEAQIRTLWEALDTLDPILAATFRMRLLTAQRGGEVLRMRRDQLDGPWWTIPARDAKNGREHRVYLSPQSLALLEDLRPRTGTSDWIFDSPRKPGFPISAVQKAAARLARDTGIPFVSHDLRRTAASHMTSMGIRRDIVSKILNHTETGVTSVYDRYSYDSEKQQALVRWGERLESVVTGAGEGSNVVRIA